MTEEMVGVCGHCEREVYGESEEREAYIKRLSEQLVRATKWAYKQVLYNDSAMMDFDDYVWMIDTKKYEGHTPAPWEITNDGIVGVTDPNKASATTKRRFSTMQRHIPEDWWAVLYLPW